MLSYWNWKQIEHAITNILENVKHEQLKSSFVNPWLWPEYSYPSYRLKNSRLCGIYFCLDEITTNKTAKSNIEPARTE
jgi:hypothetical protein